MILEQFFNLDYPSWWFLVIFGLFAGYAILDGFDLGAGAVHLFLKKKNSRRIALNAIGPVWDGNEVWLVIGGGSLFAAFPKVYAALLTSFYEPFMIFLVMLIFRAVSIEFRSKEPMAWWRKMWDISYCLSSICMSLLLGIFLGNVLLGIPIDADGNFHGDPLFFFNPYSVFVGITTLSLFMMHGAIYLVMKTQEHLHQKLRIIVRDTTIFFIISVLLLSFYTILYVPRMSRNIQANPWLFFIPVCMVLSIANITRQINRNKFISAFVFSAFTMVLLFLTVVIELFPVIIRSSIDPTYNLTIYNATASIRSLKIMSVFVIIGAPLVMSYTAFVFYTFKGKVKLDETSY